MPVIYWHFNGCLSTQNIIASMERMLGCADKMRWTGWEHTSGQKERSSRLWIVDKVLWQLQKLHSRLWKTWLNHNNQINTQFTKTSSISYTEVITGKPHSILLELLSPNVTSYKLQHTDFSYADSWNFWAVYTYQNKSHL